MCSCRHLSMQHTHTLLTHRHAWWQQTHHSHACAANTWRHEYTHKLMQGCTRRTWTWCHFLRHGDGFTHTHTHTHNCLCRSTETGNSHTDTRSPGNRHEMVTHTQHTDTCTHVHANTRKRKHAHTLLARWHANGHTHTLSHIGTCTHTNHTTSTQVVLHTGTHS